MVSFTHTTGLVCRRAAGTTLCYSILINTGKKERDTLPISLQLLILERGEKKERLLIDYQCKSCPFSTSGNLPFLDDAEASPGQR